MNLCNPAAKKAEETLTRMVSSHKTCFLSLCRMCRRSAKGLLYCFILAVFAPITGSAGLQPETVRVAVVKGVESARLDASEYLLSDEKGVPLALPLPMVVKADRQGLSVGGRSVRKLTVSSGSMVSVNGKSYRGIIEVTAGEKGLLVVNELPLEEYLVGLINCEISSQWPMEAVKAQAVVARSYAMYQKESRIANIYHLESTVLDQVYDGCSIEDTRAARGVRETEGEVLTFGGRIVQSFFHSSCGGRTEASEQVWGFPLPYLEGVECGYCTESPSVKWEQTVPLKKIESLLKVGGLAVSDLREVKAGARNRSGRVGAVILVAGQGSQEIPAVKFRKLVGYTLIRSTSFSVRTSGENAVFAGTGYGHGVGLCQWGAKNRAMNGFSYREILSYYYPGTSLRRLSAE